MQSSKDIDVKYKFIILMSDSNSIDIDCKGTVTDGCLNRNQIFKAIVLFNWTEFIKTINLRHQWIRIGCHLLVIVVINYDWGLSVAQTFITNDQYLFSILNWPTSQKLPDYSSRLTKKMTTILIGLKLIYYGFLSIGELNLNQTYQKI